MDGERGNHLQVPATSPPARRDVAGRRVVRRWPGVGRRARSSPGAGKPRAWRRSPAGSGSTALQGQEALVNTGEPWPGLDEALPRVLRMQVKLHRWAAQDPGRRFDDLHNLVCDPAFLVVAWDRV